MVEQGTHKPLVGGSNPPSATNHLQHLTDALARAAHELGAGHGAAVVLAVSGGADSMAMLHAAARTRVGWRLTVAHLDHRLRRDSAADAAFVAGAAAALDLPSATGRADVAALARSEGVSIEAAGRDARYRFLAEVAGDDGLVFTAHTADDAAETVLINLLRGTGLAGAGGIPARRGNILRPLLGERRATLRACLDAAGIAVRDDPSNTDPAFLRNRVRGELLPLLESLRPGAVDALTRFARLAGDDDALLDLIAAGELARRRGEDGRIDWGQPPARPLGRRIMRLAIGDPAPSAERVEALLEAAEARRGGLRIELGSGRMASIRAGRIGLE